MRIPRPVIGILSHRRAAAAAVLVVALALTVVADAAKSPSKASVDCRGRIADQAKSALAKSLAALDACHRARDAGKAADDCNALPLEAGKLPGKVDEKCLPGDPVLLNYGGGDASGQVVTALEDVVAASAHALENGPPLTGDPAAAKCRAAIGKARTKIVKDAVGRSIGCQKKLDKAASQFGSLAPVCAAGPSDGTIAAAAKAIDKACRRKLASKTFEPITGTTVGSCDPLPGCVATAATATGKAAAAVIYKAPLVCGDGTVDPGEDCDPGADVATDCCTAACRFTTAGTTCRDSKGVCDLAETCTGASALCPLDQKSTGQCQAPANPCAPPSQCDGVSDDCPPASSALAARMRAGFNLRSFLSRVFVTAHNAAPRFGSVTKIPKPDAGTGAAPTISFRSAQIVAGGGRQFRMFTKAPGGQNVTGNRALQSPTADRVWVVAGSADTTCPDVFTIPLSGDDTDDIDLEAEFVDDLGTDDVPVQFAIGDANGPLTAYANVNLKPTGGFLRRVRDIRPGPAGSDPRLLTSVGDTLFFVAATNPAAPRIWKSNGSAAGTIPLSPEEPDIVLRDLTAVGPLLYFDRCLGATCDLLRTDGATETPTLIAHGIDTFCSEDDAGVPLGLGSTLYFASDSRFGDPPSSTGCEPWRSDGPPLENGPTPVATPVAVTMPIADVRPGLASSAPRRLTKLGDAFLFLANDGTHGLQVWQSDGTSDGTEPRTTLHVGADVRDLTVIGDAFFFTVDQTELWGGTANDAPAKIATFDRVSKLTAVGTRLFFVGCANDAGGCELWRTDVGGTPALVRDINPTGDSAPDGLTDVAGTLFFSATDGASGRELWRSDGSEAFTLRVRDILPGSGGSDPEDLTNVAGILVFVASDGSRGREVWESNGTEDGTDRVRDFAAGGGDAKLAGDDDGPRIVAAGNVAYFVLDDGGATGAELYALKPFLGAPPPLPTPTAAPTASPTPIPTVTAAGESCCTARDPQNPEPACEVAGCGSCVCAFDPFCCQVNWDGLCAAEAAQSCPEPCPCQPTPTATPEPTPTETPGIGSCCASHETAGCEVRACQDCVCASDPFCCQQNWDQICGAEAAGNFPACSDACAVCVAVPTPTPTPVPTATPNTSTCCAAHPETGCDVPSCADCVCGSDPYCCGIEWDSICASEASGAFPSCSDACALCAVAATPTPQPTPTESPTPTPLPTATPSAPSCCVPHAETGCDVPACADCVCGADPFCCVQNWDEICVSEASGGFAQCAAQCGACAP